MSDALEKRISDLIKHSRGTMPIGIVVEGKDEAEQALAILTKKRGGKIVTVYVRVDGYDIQYKPE